MLPAVRDGLPVLCFCAGNCPSHVAAQHVVFFVAVSLTYYLTLFLDMYGCRETVTVIRSIDTTAQT